MICLLICNLMIVSHAVTHTPDSVEKCVICHIQETSHDLLSQVAFNFPFDATSTVPGPPVPSRFTRVVNTATPIRAPPP